MAPELNIHINQGSPFSNKDFSDVHVDNQNKEVSDLNNEINITHRRLIRDLSPV